MTVMGCPSIKIAGVTEAAGIDVSGSVTATATRNKKKESKVKWGRARPCD